MRLLPLALLAVAFAPGAHADPAAMRAYVDDTVRPWVADPVIMGAVRQANMARADMTETDVLTLDALWRSEIGEDQQPTILPMLGSEASQFLRDRAESTSGIVTEVLVMDARGLNVAISHVTSDGWQGDEAKFQETFPHGPDAVHLGEIDFDESTQTYQAQVSFTLVDPALGTAVGAVTVGLNADAF